MGLEGMQRAHKWPEILYFRPISTGSRLYEPRMMGQLRAYMDGWSCYELSCICDALEALNSLIWSHIGREGVQGAWK